MNIFMIITLDIGTLSMVMGIGYIAYPFHLVLFLRLGIAPLFGTYSFVSSFLPDSLHLFLCIKCVGYIS